MLFDLSVAKDRLNLFLIDDPLMNDENANGWTIGIFMARGRLMATGSY